MGMTPQLMNAYALPAKEGKALQIATSVSFRELLSRTLL